MHRNPGRDSSSKTTCLRPRTRHLLPLTTHLTDAPLLRLTVDPGQLTGLKQLSQIMVDKPTTVRRANLGQRIGRIDSKTMVAVEQSLAVFLGLGR